MSLRSRIVALYLALALIPMVVVSVGNYVQAMRSLTDLVHSKLDAASDQGVREIESRHRELRASMQMLARSQFAESLYQNGQIAEPADAEFWRDAWVFLDPSFESIEFLDAQGQVLQAASSPRKETSAQSVACVGTAANPVEIRVPLVFDGDPAHAGEMVGRVSAAALIPEDVLRGWFGRNGQRLLLAKDGGTALFDARCAAGLGRTQRQPIADWSWETAGAGKGRVTLREAGIRKVGSWVESAAAPWIVVSVAEMEEFTGPYRREQLAYLAFVMFILIAAGGAFMILAQQIMGSLEDLTRASVEIGEGELTPWLPPPGPDEVGRLSYAFSTMLIRLKAMMRQNEVARRLAVAGDVAAQLSHEIRNPLSSIRLNLQSLAREIGSGSVPSDLPQVLNLCLREIDRLDEAVGGVIELGQPRPPEMRSCRLASLAQESLAVVEPRMRKRGIVVRMEERAECDQVEGDEGQLRGVLLNLFLNAFDAMPEGGALSVWTESGAGPAGAEVRLHVADSGRGVRPELRQLVFEPFFTTKAGGSGIGLSGALQVVEAHNGRLYLANGASKPQGAEFVVALPLAEEVTPAGAMDADPPSRVTECRPWQTARGRVERV